MNRFTGLVIIATLAGFLQNPCSNAAGLEDAVVSGSWQVVYESLATAALPDQSVKDFLKDMACLNLDLDCGPSVCVTSLPEAKSLTSVENWLTSLSNTHPNAAVLQYLLGMVYSREGRSLKARSCLDRAIRMDSTLGAAYLQRGALQLMAGVYRSALSDYDLAIRYLPGYSRGFMNRGGAYDALGQYDRALADYDSAIAISPDRAGPYYNRGNTHRHLGDNESAIKDFSDAIGRDSTIAAAFYNRGNTYADLGDKNAALNDYQTFVRIAPDDMKSAIPMARAKMAELSRSAAGSGGKSARYWLDLGTAALQQGVFDQALSNLNKAIALDSALAEAYYYRAAVYATLGNSPEAIANFSHAIHLRPGDTTAYYNRGLLYSYDADYRGAIADFSTAIRLNENYPLAYIARAETYEKTGQVDSALADYETYIKICPTNESEQRAKIAELIGFLKSGARVNGLADAKAAVEEAYRAWERMDWRALSHFVLSADLESFRRRCLPIMQITLPPEVDQISLGGEDWRIDSISIWPASKFFQFAMAGFSDPGSPFHDVVTMKLIKVTDVLPRGVDRVQYQARVSYGSTDAIQEAVLEGFAVRTESGWKIELPALFTNIADMMSVAMDH